MEDMPRSMSRASARTSSSASIASPSTKSARTNRVAHTTSAVNSSKRASASGSRSIAMSRPSGPRRSAIARACPPAPNVQSTATPPRGGARRSTVSCRSTGTWVAVMSTRMAKALGDAGDLAGQVAVEVLPGPAVPDLEGLGGPGHHDLLVQAGVLDEGGRELHAPGRVQLGVEGVRGEPEAHAAGVGGHRVQPLQRALDDRVVRVGDPDVDVALEALGEDHPSAELGAELRRDREAVLCIERVVE